MKKSRDGKKVSDVKIAYIGGGSRGWARGLMSDLALEERLSGTVYLYDIDYGAAKDNEIIGNKINSLPQNKTDWKYKAVKTAAEAMTDADFVVISILPGTFEQMRSDVHTPEKYGIFQSVGDTVGPGGIVRAMRTIPMYKEIAENIKAYCPAAWVINYTNPMTVCTRTLYEVFPEIKAFGCCHEVFGTQEFIANVFNEYTGIYPERHEILANVVGINHFTWMNSIKCRGEDVLAMMKDYAQTHKDGMASASWNWMNKNFTSNQAVKLDLMRRYGILAAAGDRHLAEFCPGSWYLDSPEQVASYKFKLTTVQWRIDAQQMQIKETKELVSGKKKPEIKPTGEEGVHQMAALCGLDSYVTNVNVPNRGQISSLPLGAVVETNAYFSGDSVQPIYSGAIQGDVNSLIIRHVYNQETIVKETLAGNYNGVFRAFVNDPNVQLSLDKARVLFDEMLFNTKEYLPYYDRYLAEKAQNG